MKKTDFISLHPHREIPLSLLLGCMVKHDLTEEFYGELPLDIAENIESYPHGLDSFDESILDEKVVTKKMNEMMNYRRDKKKPWENKPTIIYRVNGVLIVSSEPLPEYEKHLVTTKETAHA